MLRTLCTVRKVPLEVKFPKAPPDAVDLIKKLVVFNPNKRLSAADALQHPFVKIFESTGEDIVCSAPIRIPIDDNVRYSVNEYRTRLYNEIIAKKKELRKQALQRQRNRSTSRSSRPITNADSSKRKDGAKGRKWR
ncbi:hypothetical protein GEMRC1_010869 [Eukaryota sp. GEM-RC1]